MNFWFGWLIKGKCEISLLDVLVLIGELGFVFILYLIGQGLYLKLKR